MPQLEPAADLTSDHLDRAVAETGKGGMPLVGTVLAFEGIAQKVEGIVATVEPEGKRYS